MAQGSKRRGPREQKPAVDMAAIAAKLGVSKTTVHYALSEKGRVSKAVREAILAAAKEMGYQPNLLARSLRTKRTNSIGVILSSATSSFHAHLLESIDQAAQWNNYHLLLACSYRDTDKEQALLKMMLSKGVDGVIMAPTSSATYYDLFDGAMPPGVPVVFVDREIPQAQIDCVSADNFVGGKMAGEHLIENGRTRCAFLTIARNRSISNALAERLAGFDYALRKADLPPARVLTADADHEAIGETVGLATIGAALKSDRHAMDGLFTANDNLAYGAMQAIRDAGLNIPGDVSVVGFDDQDASAYVTPPLTTIRQPVRSIGAAAVDQLIKRIGAQSSPESVKAERIKIEPMLVRRSSS